MCRVIKRAEFNNEATSRRLKARVLIVYALTIHFFKELNCFAR